MLLRVSRDGEIEGDYWPNLYQIEQQMTKERLKHKRRKEAALYEAYREWQKNGYPVHKEKAQKQKRRGKNGKSVAG